MATFNPTGLSWAFSQGTASQATPTLVEYPWNPLFSGYTNDIAVMLIPAGDNNVGGLSSEDGFVYPLYVDTTVDDPNVPNVPPIIGVIAGFKYEPINNNPYGLVNFPSYVKNTPVKNGKVTVLVQTDVQAQYSIQSKPETALGIAQSFLFGYAKIGCDTTYDIDVGGGKTYSFPIGGDDGISRCYLKEPVELSNFVLTLSTGNYWKNQEYPLFIQNVTTNQSNGENNNWWNPANPLENQNNIVNVSLVLPAFVTTSAGFAKNL